MKPNRLASAVLLTCFFGSAAIASDQLAEAKQNANQAAPAQANNAEATAKNASDSAALAAAIAGDWRDPSNVARDVYRNPLETLSFFGVKPNQTVVEISPGVGWYTEILAPLLREQGRYVGAVVDPTAVAEGSGRDYQQRTLDGLGKKYAASPAQFDKVTLAKYAPATPSFGADGSADVVLTFRNVHNWRGSGQAEGMFKGFFNVLKSGGVLGVVEHRANADVAADDKSGYVGVAQVIALAESAGFKLDAQSEINANPKDTKDHPKGVWMLPPGNRHDAADAAKFKAIGESDRMTLRFVKP